MSRSLNPGIRKSLRKKSQARRHVNVAWAEVNKNKPKKSPQANEPLQNRDPSPIDLNQVEFHRHGLALVPNLSDKRPGVAYLLKETASQPDLRICSCSIAKRQTCPHILKLVELYKAFLKKYEGKPPQEAFRSSLWYRVAAILADKCRETPKSVHVQFVDFGSRRSIRVIGSDGQEMLSYLSQSADATRFLERLGQVPEDNVIPHRGDLLEDLALFTLSDSERTMREMGVKTIRKVLEESFWYRIAYHCFREYGEEEITFLPAIEEGSGAFQVTCKRSDGESALRMAIPREKVKGLLTGFKELLPNQHGLTIHPIPLKSIFKISANTELDLEVRPIIQVLQEGGEAKFFDREDLERFRYGELIYIKEIGILAELEPPGKMERKFVSPIKMMLKKSQVPMFLQEFCDDLQGGLHLVDATVKRLKVYDRFDRVEIIPEAIDRDWCWLSLRYGFGNSSVSLAEILLAKKEGQRFISTMDGWVDCLSQEFQDLDPILDRFSMERLDDQANRMKLSRMDLLRLKVTSPRPLGITGDPEMTSWLQRMFELKPASSLPELKGLTSVLRPYQKLGVEWLLFLFENGLGGLLCDDMGTGKTHEVMAFLLTLTEHKGVKGPFLVVCPTTVLSHWYNKISVHALGLRAAVFHGGQRDLDETLKDNNVLLTSYGILRNDIERLKQVRFSVAIFDEIQNIKNHETLGHRAAIDLNATMKLGLTGTPMENYLSELKALLDLTVPGYLGNDEDFNSRYVKPIEQDPASAKRQPLSRLISPFTLRRLKKTVLRELPEKIEDIRTCNLSDDQIKLYRDAVSSRGIGLIDTLERGEEPIPYIHIFALLNLLKQICNHPALVDGRGDDFEKYQSGKWDLFKELIDESLESGQKVVVYSQFLGMIRIITQHLQGLGVEFVTLTGSSRNRGEIVSRFNDDPDCRVYVGSLKAGGTGIDLVAASVVLHYDRWWNAAKEDQATDRVHRIGQRRGVQVFKLVTEGTLEEKISAIIDRKRNLMDSIVKEDDPSLLKTFSREDLIEMLSPPS
jgi:superfamily II DNA or RNA helicase